MTHTLVPVLFCLPKTPSAAGVRHRAAMGIKGLTKLIADKAPDAIREGEIGNYFSENSTPVHCCVTRAHSVEGQSVPLEIANSTVTFNDVNVLVCNKGHSVPVQHVRHIKTVRFS